jgi:hypothetical protein
MGNARPANESGPTLPRWTTRKATKATQVKNEGAFPPADARTDRLEEGCDERRLMPSRSIAKHLYPEG